jgi:hypothetical protein
MVAVQMEDKGHMVLGGDLDDPVVCKAMEVRLVKSSAENRYHVKVALNIDVFWGEITTNN